MAAAVRVTEAMKAVNEGTAMEEGYQASAERVVEERAEAMKAVNEGTAMEEGHQVMEAMQAGWEATAVEVMEGLMAVRGDRMRSRTHSCTTRRHSCRMTTRRTV
jgi:hypothetical protein